MAKGTYTVQLKDRKIEVTSRDLAVRCFATCIWERLNSPAICRELLWLDIYSLDAEFGVSPHDILKGTPHALIGRQKGQFSARGGILSG